MSNEELQLAVEKMTSTHVLANVNDLVYLIINSNGIEALEESFEYKPSTNEWDEEILEYWLVDLWLGERLAEKNETIWEGWGSCIWGRKTSGQAIFLDGVMEEIYKDLMCK